MFDKQRESLEASKNYQKVKLHLQTNKRTYITGASCFVAGGVIFSKRPELKQTVDSFKFQWQSPTTNVVTATLTRRGHPGYIIKCCETGEMFASQNRAAEANAITAAMLSAHLNGKYPHAGGRHFERIGEAI
jgi:hypothetical protein